MEVEKNKNDNVVVTVIGLDENLLDGTKERFQKSSFSTSHRFENARNVWRYDIGPNNVTALGSLLQHFQVGPVESRAHGQLLHGIPNMGHELPNSDDQFDHCTKRTRSCGTTKQHTSSALTAAASV